MNVAFFEAITPYWVDMNNHLYKELDFKHYYIYREYQNFDTESLKKELYFEPNYLKKNVKNAFRFRELYRIIKENKPKNVISVEFSLLTVQLLIIKFLLFKRFKLIIRTDNSYEMLSNGFTRRNRIARRILSPFIDNFIVCDKKVHNWYHEHYKRGCYFPIIRKEEKFIKNFKRASSLNDEARKKYGIGDEIVVLYVGRLVKIKNIDIVLDAIDTIKDKRITFLVCGDGEDRERLAEKAKHNRHKTVFTGRLNGDELLACYNIADIFILPSTIEPFGAVTNEALVSGCHCIISNLAGSVGIIEEGANGYPFTPTSKEELAGCILKLTDKIEKTGYRNNRKNLMQNTFDEYFNNIKNIIK